MDTPKGLKYAKTDEWIKVEGDQAVIGITDYAQDQLSDVVFIEFMIEEGDQVGKGDPLATLESVKAASDVNFPASGTVMVIHEDLVDEPEAINSGPYESGWMIKITLADPSELDELMDADEYETYTEEREG